MIVARIRCGLGNQMFQYAAARRLAEQHDTHVELDTRWYRRVPRGNIPRHYELGQLSVTGTVARRSMQMIRETPLPLRPRELHRVLRPGVRAARERHVHFDPAVLTLPDDVWMSGFWMSEKYFVDIAPTIRTEFAVRAAPSARNARCIERMAGCNSVAVHVRRTDYLNPQSRQGFAGLDFYGRAVASIRERCADPVFFVFSDDPQWARRHLELGGETHVVDHNRGAASTEDLRLMTSCRHNIIANSSYSWWAAWLNPHPERVVIAPRTWLVQPGVDTSDVLPADWIAV